MTAWTLARRGITGLVRWWWQSARPSAGADLGGRRRAQPAHVTGRPPTPTERWVATTEPTGPWAGVDPHTAGGWPRRGSLLGLAGWAALVAVRVRRDLRRAR